MAKFCFENVGVENLTESGVSCDYNQLNQALEEAIENGESICHERVAYLKAWKLHAKWWEEMDEHVILSRIQYKDVISHGTLTDFVTLDFIKFIHCRVLSCTASLAAMLKHVIADGVTQSDELYFEGCKPDPILPVHGISAQSRCGIPVLKAVIQRLIDLAERGLPNHCFTILCHDELLARHFKLASFGSS